MLSLFRKRHPPVGARPGTLVVTESDLRPRMSVVCYDGEGVEEAAIATVAELDRYLVPGRVVWLDVQGLGDEQLLRTLGDRLQLHPLALEDVVNVPQRPKIEEYAEQLFVITRMARLVGASGLDVEQVAIVIGSTWVLSFQEHYGDILDPVRVRIREGKGPLRHAGPDYLAYALLDTIVDGYFPVMEELGERVARLESRIMTRPHPTCVDRINEVKSVLDTLRRGIWPQREALNRLPREPTRFLSDQVRLYLRDTTDHCAQLVDAVDSHRDLVNGLMNTYLSVMSHRTNEVMKVLTIMASIFIPLTFLAGIYGMNFERMPELHSVWGYPVALTVMVLSAGGMLLWFRRRGWLGGGAEDDGDDDA
jgi:magnesium transporter